MYTPTLLTSQPKLRIKRPCLQVPGSGAYFAGNEFAKRMMMPAGGTVADLGPGQLLLAGGTAGHLGLLSVLLRFCFNCCVLGQQSRRCMSRGHCAHALTGRHFQLDCVAAG